MPFLLKGEIMKEFAAFVAFVAIMAALIFGVAKATLGDDGPVHHVTINRADFAQPEVEIEDSGDSELAHIKFANAVDRLTGWSDLSMDEQAVRVKAAGMAIEAFGKIIPKNPITGGFLQGFFRQVGVQMQVQAMHHLDEISHEPAIAFCQGVLIGM